MKERIIKLIKEKAKSEREFALKIGIGQQNLNNQITGKRKISLEVVEAIIKTFPDISYEWLMTGNGYMLKENEYSQNDVTTKERLKEFVQALNLGQNAFEKEVGIANGYLASKSKTITSDTIEKVINKYPNLNIEWLMTGNGNMLKENGISSNKTINKKLNRNRYQDMDVNSRIRSFLKDKKITVQSFESAIGKTNGYLSHTKSPTAGVLETIATVYPELNIEWLITGRGDMLKKSEAPTDEVTKDDQIEFLKAAIGVWETSSSIKEKEINSLKAENQLLKERIKELEKDIMLLRSKKAI